MTNRNSRSRRSRWNRLALGFATMTLVGGWACPAFAVDGVVLIDQNRALAGNVTPGDAPGFPVTLSVPGSYRLSGNLTVPALIDGIEIGADDITLDLNGFRIAGSGSGIGIIHAKGPSGATAGRTGIVVRNGTVRNFGIGIDLQSGSSNESCEIHQIRVVDNTDFGILVGNKSAVNENTVIGNRLVGIGGGGNSIIKGNIVTENGRGLDLDANALVIGNNLSGNRDAGMLVRCPSQFVQNAILEGAGIIVLGIGCTFVDNVIP